jgi:hypothetical protein
MQYDTEVYEIFGESINHLYRFFCDMVKKLEDKKNHKLAGFRWCYSMEMLDRNLAKIIPPERHLICYLTIDSSVFIAAETITTEDMTELILAQLNKAFQRSFYHTTLPVFEYKIVNPDTENAYVTITSKDNHWCNSKVFGYDPALTPIDLMPYPIEENKYNIIIRWDPVAKLFALDNLKGASGKRTHMRRMRIEKKTTVVLEENGVDIELPIEKLETRRKRERDQYKEKKVRWDRTARRNQIREGRRKDRERNRDAIDAVVVPSDNNDHNRHRNNNNTRTHGTTNE